MGPNSSKRVAICRILCSERTDLCGERCDHNWNFADRRCRALELIHGDTADRIIDLVLSEEPKINMSLV